MLKFERDFFIRDNLDWHSTDLFNWDMVLVSSLYKKEYKNDENEKEVINGYANAVVGFFYAIYVILAVL